MFFTLPSFNTTGITSSDAYSFNQLQNAHVFQLARRNSRRIRRSPNCSRTEASRRSWRRWLIKWWWRHGRKRSRSRRSSSASRQAQERLATAGCIRVCLNRADRSVTSLLLSCAQGASLLDVRSFATRNDESNYLWCPPPTELLRSPRSPAK